VKQSLAKTVQPPLLQTCLHRVDMASKSKNDPASAAEGINPSVLQAVMNKGRGR
jgi:hypothetical protein